MIEYDKVNRTYVISGCIDEEIAKQVVWVITKINEIDNSAFEELNPNKYQPLSIKLIINTPGGEVLQGFSIVDAIESSLTPVITIATGQVASMGVPIFLAGHERYATRHAWFMLHNMSSGLWGSSQDLKLTAEHIDKLMKQYENILFSKTKFPKDKWESILKEKIDYWFDVEEAKEYGFVDKKTGILPTVHEVNKLYKKKAKKAKLMELYEWVDQEDDE